MVRPIALTLPGQGDGNAGASLADQLAYLLAAIDASQHPVLVGHSAASTLVWMAASHRPARVRGVIMIGGFPAAGGEAYADFFPVHEGVMPFPGWEAFEHADVADLDVHDREELRAVMDPVPEGVATGEVTYKDEQRFSIPVGVVCPEFSTEDAKHGSPAATCPNSRGCRSGISALPAAFTSTRPSQPRNGIRACNPSPGAFLRAASPVM